MREIDRDEDFIGSVITIKLDKSENRRRRRSI